MRKGKKNKIKRKNQLDAAACIAAARREMLKEGESVV